MTPAQQAREAGFNLSLVDESLRLTPEQRLSDAGIEFVVVGGVAAVLHGSSMVTRDLEVCTELSSQNLQRLRDAFRDLHPVHRIGPARLSFLEVPEPGESLRNLYLQTDLGALDLLAVAELRAIASREEH